MRLSKILKLVKNHVPDDYYVWMETFFRVELLSPPKDAKKKFIYVLLAVPHFFLCIILQNVFESWKIIIDVDEDFKTTMINLSRTTLAWIISFRILFWFFTAEKVYAVTKIIQRDSFNFECFGIRKNRYGHILKAVEDKEKHGEILKYKDLKKLWKTAKVFLNKNRNEVEDFRKEKMMQTRMLCCFLFLSGNLTCIFYIAAFYIKALLAGTYEEFNARLNVTSTYRTFTLDIYFPFDTSVSQGYYWLASTYQIYAIFARLLAYWPVDTIITNTIIHIIGQTKVVGEAFLHVDKNVDRAQSAEEILLIKEIRITKCIAELQEIYRAVFLLKDLCDMQLFIQYGMAIIVLCAQCYIVPLVNDPTDFICAILFVLTTLGEIFIFTYCAQTLSQELQKLVSPVYSLDWSSYPPSLTRKLVFLIVRLQQKDILTAGKIFNLDLLFFLQIVQRTYSFYTLITNASNTD